MGEVGGWGERGGCASIVAVLSVEPLRCFSPFANVSVVLLDLSASAGKVSACAFGGQSASGKSYQKE